jgi:hypothetical protein
MAPGLNSSERSFEMIIYCRECRGRIKRVGSEWRHEKETTGTGHAAQPVAARRCLLFDASVVGLPGYDRALAWLVEAERAAKAPVEAWRVGLYVFDGRIRGVFRYNGEAGSIKPGSLFRAPEVPSDAYLRNHPIVKERLAAIDPARKKAPTAKRSATA